MPKIKHAGSLSAWFICFVGTLLLFYDFINMSLMSSLGDYFTLKYDLTAAALGSLSANLFYGNVIMQIPCGYFSDRFSLKKVLMIGMLVGSISVFCLAFANSLPEIRIYRFIMGLVSGYGFVTTMRLTSNWFSSKSLGVAMGAMLTFGMAGAVVAGGPLAALVGYVGGKNAIILLGVLGLVFFVLITLFVEDYPTEYLDHHLKDSKATHRKDVHFIRGVVMILKNIQTWLVSFYIALINLPIMIFGYIWGTQYLEHVYKFDTVTSSSISSMIFIGTIFGNPIIGLISDKMQSRKKPMLLCACLSIIVVYFLINLQTPSVPLLCALFFLLGFMSGAMSLGYPYAIECNDKLVSGLVLGIVGVAVQGMSMLQPIFGYVIDKVSVADGMVPGILTAHAFRTAAWIFPISFLIAFLLSCFFRKKTF
jgi:MFS family permease